MNTGEKRGAMNKFPHEPRTEFPLGRYGRRRRQEDNKMPFTQKANNFGLFENERAPDKSDLSGQISITCPQCKHDCKY